MKISLIFEHYLTLKNYKNVISKRKNFARFRDC